MHIIELGHLVSLEERYPHLVPKGPLARQRFDISEKEAQTAADQLAAYNSHALAQAGAATRGPRFTAEDVANMRAATQAAAPSAADLLARIEALEAANKALREELDAANSAEGAA
jgi:hypothetical protein